MTPTICPRKKRQARSDLRQNIRRTHLNLALSDIVNYGCQRTANDGTSRSLRPGLRLEERRGIGGLQMPANGTSYSEDISTNNYRQLLVDVSDNAVTSSSSHLNRGQSEASSSMRSSSGYLSNSTNYDTNTDTSQPPARRTSSLGEGRTTSQYPFGDDEDADFESVSEDAEGHSKNTVKYELDCETDSMTSLDTEKSAKLKRCNNNPQLRDKWLAEHRYSKKKPPSNIRNAEGLLSIALKTIKLVKRNQLLQQRLSQLQLETSEFIQSVLANPENRHFRGNIQQNVM